jgi:ABC-2 type transport system permease protein
MRAVVAQARVELLLTLRRGESVLLTFAIPVLLLAFFSTVDVLPTPERIDDPVDFLVPGILALAVMSTAMVSLAIATGFERSTGVLKLLGSTPLTRPQLLVAKVAAIVVVEVLQVAVLVAEGALLGWEVEGAQVAAAGGALALATVAFAGIGMLMAGTLPALTTLAAANGLYLLLLLVGGMVVPLDELGGLEPVAKLLPSGALSEATHGALEGGGIPGLAWVVLGAWAVAAPLLAAWRFRWE